MRKKFHRTFNDLIPAEKAIANQLSGRVRFRIRKNGTAESVGFTFIGTERSREFAENLQVISRFDTLSDVEIVSTNPPRYLRPDEAYHLAELPGLEFLFMQNVRIDETVICELAKCQLLRRLELFASPFQDGKLRSLGKMKMLETLFITDYVIDKQQVGKIRMDLPECRIVTRELRGSD